MKRDSCIKMQDKSRVFWFTVGDHQYAEGMARVWLQVYVGVKEMSLRHKALIEIVKPLLSVAETRFERKREQTVYLNCNAIKVSYCSDILEVKSCLASNKGRALKPQFVRSLTMMEDSRNIRGCKCRRLMETKNAKEYYR